MASASTTGQWSPWFNSDRPWLGAGDVETLKSIEHHFGPVCGFRETIEATQCQLTKYGQEFTDITAHTLRDDLKIPCTSNGLLCLNSQQVTGMCQDYAVRFLCTLRNDSDVREQDTDYFPQFDARIYIILAVVPILVFLLRILWGFVFRRRRHQRRRRARRNGHDDDDDDSSSVASSLANAPPSYHQLFGNLGTNRANGGNSSIFAITRSTISVCQGCKETKCSVAKVLFPSSSPSSLSSSTTSPVLTSNSQQGSSSSNTTVVIPVSEDVQENILQHCVQIEENGSLSATCGTLQDTLQKSAHDQPSSSVVSDNSSPGTQDSIPQNADEIQSSTTFSMQVEPENQTTSTQIDSTNTSELNPSSNIPREEILLTALSTPVISNVISHPCPCACHRTVAISTSRGRSISSSGFDNGGFSSEGDQIIHHSTNQEVPTLQRVYSNLSNGSVITLSELPSYEDALDLIKKKEQKLVE